MINRYPGKCAKCGAHVDARAGRAENRHERWFTYHTACAPVYTNHVKKNDNLGPNWKPAHCNECSVKHPSFSHDGIGGPWRCKSCHDKTASKPPEKITYEPIDNPQGSLF